MDITSNHINERSELKPKSLRISEDTIDKFKSIVSEFGTNQDTALAKLIETYKIQAGKYTYGNKKDDIEKFESYINIVTQMFINTIAESQNLNEVIHAKFSEQLNSKDSIIQDIQNQLAISKQSHLEADKIAKSSLEQISKLEADINKIAMSSESRITDLLNQLIDKDNLNNILTSTCDELKNKLSTQAADVEKYDHMKEKYLQTAASKDELEKQLQHQQSQFEIKLEKLKFELRNDYQEKLQLSIDNKNKEIEKYQQKYLELLERLKEKETADDHTIN